MLTKVQVAWVGTHRVEITWGVPHSFHYDLELTAHVVWIYDVNNDRVVIPIHAILKWQELKC